MGLEEVGVQLVVDGADTFKSAMSGALDAVTGFATMGLQALGKGFAFAFEQAVEGEQQMAALEQLIKSTGGAAGVTMDDVKALGARFQDLAGGTDDAVNSIIEFGLRSGNITSDEMPAFIQASLDLGTVMGDNATAARLLARAQEDPVGTLGALRRAGILFTEDQQEQIKALVKTGDTAAATDLLMQQLAETTGGAAAAQAETFAGKMEILQGRLGEAAETIGSAFLPIASQLFDTVIAPAIPVIEDLALKFGTFISGFTTAGGPVESFVALIQENLPAIQETATAVFGSIVDIATTLWTVFQTELVPVLGDLFTAIFGEAPGAQDTMTNMLTAIKDGAEVAATWVRDVLAPAIASWADWVQVNLIPLIADVVDWLQVNVPIAIEAATDAWNNVIYPALVAIWDYLNANVVPMLTTLAQWLGENLPVAMGVLVDFWNTTLSPALTALWAFIVDPLSPILADLAELVGAILVLAFNALATVWNDVLSPALSALWTFIKDNLTPTTDQLHDAFDSLGAGIQWLTDLIWSMAAALDGIKIPDELIPGSPTPFEIGLRGIARAAIEASDALADVIMPKGAMPEIRAAVGFGRSAPPVFGGAGTGFQGGPTTNNNVTVNASYGREMSPPSIWGDINLGLTLAAM